MRSLRTLIAAAGLAAMTVSAAAHHGWSWTEDGFFTLTGTIESIDLGNPHAVMDVEANGETWRVELAPPSATARSGFTEASAKVGDEVTAVGNRSQDADERRMKAVRITVNGQTYDVYPSRVPTN